MFDSFLSDSIISYSRLKIHKKMPFKLFHLACERYLHPLPVISLSSFLVNKYQDRFEPTLANALCLTERKPDLQYDFYLSKSWIVRRWISCKLAREALARYRLPKPEKLLFTNFSDHIPRKMRSFRDYLCYFSFSKTALSKSSSTVYRFSSLRPQLT